MRYVRHCGSRKYVVDCREICRVFVARSICQEIPVLLTFTGETAVPNRSRIGRVRDVLLIIVFLMGIGTCCCLSPIFVGSAYREDMVAGYAVWAIDALDEAAVVRKTSPHGAVHVVGPTISAYGWNNDFILAKQHPANWFIIEVKGGKVHGPLTKEQYMELRQTLGVPSDLAFTKSVPWD